MSFDSEIILIQIDDLIECRLGTEALKICYLIGVRSKNLRGIPHSVRFRNLGPPFPKRIYMNPRGYGAIRMPRGLLPK